MATGSRAAKLTVMENVTSAGRAIAEEWAVAHLRCLMCGRSAGDLVGRLVRGAEQPAVGMEVRFSVFSPSARGPRLVLPPHHARSRCSVCRGSVTADGIDVQAVKPAETRNADGLSDPRER